MSDLIDGLRKNKEFQAVMQEILKNRPIVPVFSLCKTKDEQEMVIEAIKHHTALRMGYDLLYQLLTGKSPNT